MMEIPCGMQEQFLEAKQLIESSNDIKIYTHTDCDGICSGAILSIILDRLNKDYEIEKGVHFVLPFDVKEWTVSGNVMIIASEPGQKA